MRTASPITQDRSWSLSRWIRDRCHWQNLTRREKGTIFRHGRAWFHRKWKDDIRPNNIRVEWSVWRNDWGVRLDIGGGDAENDVTAHVAFGLLSLYLTVEGVVPSRVTQWGERRAIDTKWMGYEYMAWPRKTGINIHNGSIWFNIWNWDHGWSHDQPKWMSFSFDMVDFLFGKQVYSSKEINAIPYMRGILFEGEGVYPVEVMLTSDSWKRPRWPWPQTIRRAHVECEKGIPKPGKGENSWDCGEDAIYPLTCPASTVEEALGKMKASVMRDRERYGGKNWKPAGIRANV